MIEPVLSTQLSRARRGKHAMFLAARLVVLPALRVGIRMRVYGLSNVPKRGGALVICNHVDWFDPVLLLAASPRPILWMAKAEFLRMPILSWFGKQAGAFPVERGKPDRSALRHAQQLLDDGLLVGMFPEGTRSATGALKAPFSGASVVALRSNAPIIPCALVGTDDLPMSGQKERIRPRRRYPKVNAIFGEPFVLEAVDANGRKRGLDELTDAMMVEIARLLPESYRGIYAERCSTSHPAIRRDAIQFTGIPDA